MATGIQFIVVNHADIIVQLFGTHISGIVIGTVYLQDFLHIQVQIYHFFLQIP